MDTQQGYNLAKRLSHPLFESMSIGFMALAWLVFTFSAYSYESEWWFLWLLYSRVVACILGFSLLGYIIIKNKFYKNYSVLYLVFSFTVQASHGYFEGPQSVDFFNFTGLIFILASISYNGTFKRWCKTFLVFQVLVIVALLLTKDESYFSSLSKFVDSFSLIVSGLIIGISSAYLTSSRFTFMKSYLLEKEEKFNIARQVVHDIRSPLELLKGMKQEMLILPESSRRKIQMSINRMEEISYNLLKTHANGSNAGLESDRQQEELISLLESIILEKNFEYSLNHSVQILGAFDPESYGIFSNVRRGSLKRVLSNLVNNGVEALEGKTGVVTLNAYSEDGWNVIEVSDTGMGIPEELKDAVFNKGFTTKEKGSGLGLSGAFEEVRLLGGKLSIESKLGHGTTVRILLPKSEASQSFVKSIDVYRYDKIIILDDDLAFHEIWRSKLLSVKEKVESFYSVKGIFEKYSELPSKTLLLSDFELMDDENDGVDIILKYNNARDSILVTARSEERSVQERCLEDGIKLLSKGTIHYININITPPQVILIDDDKLIRLDWKSYFEKINRPFKSYCSIKMFMDEADLIPKESLVYIDSNLGDGLKGEIESEKLFNLGFQNLFLATGYQKEDISRPSWIKEIYSKNPRTI